MPALLGSPSGPLRGTWLTRLVGAGTPLLKLSGARDTCDVSDEHLILRGDAQAVLKAAITGYKRAARRHEELVSGLGGSEAGVYVSLAESLFWAIAIDEILDARDRNYRQRRNRDARAEFLPGLRLARNQLTHAVGQVTVKGDAPFFVKGGGLFHLGKGWIWRDVKLLPEVAGRRAALQRANYEKHLQGRLTYETLALLKKWFAEEVRPAPGRSVS
jgi:hypothetical protein